jgi:hypothetical protein
MARDHLSSMIYEWSTGPRCPLQLLYGAASDTFTPYGDDSSFGKTGMLRVAYACRGKRLHFHGIGSEIEGTVAKP